MAGLKVYITNKQKVIKIPAGIRLLIRRCCHAVLQYENFTQPAEVSVTFLDNAQIRQLNCDYRKKDKSTDVLSFPLGENGVYDINEETGASLLGDVAISMETALAQSKEYGHTLQREVAFLTVHSMLHLLGYDHEAGGLPASQMREKEEAILTKLGVSRNSAYVMMEEMGK